jgi:hypothetical protein
MIGFTSRLLAAALAFPTVFASGLAPAVAQNVSAIVTSSSSAPPAAGPVVARERDIGADLIRDQRDIWTSPFRLHKRDTKWLVPAGLAFGLMLGTDREINEHVALNPGLHHPSAVISRFGAGYTLLGASGAMYLAGRFGGHDRLRETGLLAFEALVDQYVVVTALKQATNRERPEKVNGNQDFWDGGSAFPSGHTAASWAFASVVAHEYDDVPAVKWAAYGLAATVTVARVTSSKHSPSDVFVGAVVGYLIGRHVTHRAGAGDHVSVDFAPLYRPESHTAGVSATIGF